MASVSAGGTLCFGVVNVGEKFGVVIWDNVVLANSAVARVRGICRPLFDMLFSALGVEQPWTPREVLLLFIK